MRRKQITVQCAVMRQIEKCFLTCLRFDGVYSVSYQLADGGETECS